MQLEEAKHWVKFLGEEIAPFCWRWSVGGSIRRQRPEVKDIELIVIPKWANREIQGTLFPESETRNLLFEWAQSTKFVQWIKTGTLEIIPRQIKEDGKYWRGIVKGVVKLDMFLVNAQNWGSQLMIRTGGKDFSAYMVTRAMQMGFQWKDGHLLRDGEVVPMAEEQDVFKILNIAFVEPKNRNDRPGK